MYITQGTGYEIQQRKTSLVKLSIKRGVMTYDHKGGLKLDYLYIVVLSCIEVA